MSKRQKKVTGIALLLAIWQLGLGFMLTMSSVHAQGTHAAAMASIAIAEAGADAAPACHGHDAQIAGTARPLSSPPCCQSHGCQGDCFATPALPVTPRVLIVSMSSEFGVAVVRHALFTPPLDQVFRPPI
ncbi:MAG: CopL family metal-binding regulatory protein [Pseudomonadota bacterium]